MNVGHYFANEKLGLRIKRIVGTSPTTFRCPHIHNYEVLTSSHGLVVHAIERRPLRLGLVFRVVL